MPAVPKAVIASPSEAAGAHHAKASRFGFPPAFRLHKTEEFSSVFCFGLIPSTKAAKRLARRAHTRNLVKRIARERFRLLRAGLPAHDLIVRLHAKLDAVPRAGLRADLDALYGRLPALR